MNFPIPHHYRLSYPTFNVDLILEYLYLPAVKTQYASEFGHLIRILSIYAKVEHALDEMNGSCFTFLSHFLGSQMLLIAPEILGNPAATLVESEQKMEVCPFSRVSSSFHIAVCIGMGSHTSGTPSLLGAKSPGSAIDVRNKLK